MSKLTLSRRGLLSAGVVLSVSPIVSGANAQEKKTGLVPEKWDLTTEVLVVGSGGAGLASAVSAAEAGAKVTVIEKLAFVGGNTMISSGYFNAVDPERQKKQGIEDSIEKHIQQTLAGGDGRADPELVRILCTNALGTLHWLEGMGLKFRPDVMQVYGALWPRSHLATEPKGTGFIRVLSDK
ncbi:FAD-dependent oxidoreductase, partial [Turicimonas muris]